jgi:hypothetical protein
MKNANQRFAVVGKSVFSIVLMLVLSYFSAGNVFANNPAGTNYAVSGAVGLLSLGVNPNLLVDVNSDSLTIGPITIWTNLGALGGSFGNDGTSPTVAITAGRKAVVFDGSDRMLATFTAPATITGNDNWTICVWAYNPVISSEECMVQWANRGTTLRTAQFNYGNHGTWGAATHWGSVGDMPYGGGVPTAGQWHHIALTYTGGTNGTETVYVDGQYNFSETKTLNLLASSPIRLANTNADNKVFSGSLASVQIYSYALTDTEVAVLSQSLTATIPNPASGSTAPRNTDLSWRSGTKADTHDVYFGTNSTQVTNATPTSHPGVTYENVDVNSYDPGVLNFNQNYYWRVDEVNNTDVWKGDVWSFTTDGNIDLVNDFFRVKIDISDSGVTMLKRVNDSFNTDFVLSPADYTAYGKTDPGWLLGDIISKYRVNGAGWLTGKTQTSTDNRVVTVDDPNNPRTVTYSYLTNSSITDGIKNFQLTQVWHLDGNSLSLNMNIKNTSGGNLEFGDLSFPMPFDTIYYGSTADIQSKHLMRHEFTSGSCSYMLWSKVNGLAPYLVMTTQGDTKLEYYEVSDENGKFLPYMYSSVAGPAVSGTWRQPYTSKTLSPGQEMSIGFEMRWADNYKEASDVLYDSNDFDIEVLPGMTIPQDLYAMIKLRTKRTIDSITAEYPAQTVITYAGQPQPDTYLYKVQFSKLGENLITINHDSNQKTYLEFFSTQDLETLIKKRASHLVNYQQVKDAAKWYDGLVGPWDMRNAVVRTPDNTDGFDGWWGYVIACDDPGLSHVPYIAAKNVFYPVQSEINACEYYIENFVWGGLQQTTAETYPYGIYSVPNWYQHRVTSPCPTCIGRIFDYPHIANLYYCMYKIAKNYPDMVHYLDKNGYLERAYRTALANYTIPYTLNGATWQWETGTMDEVIYLDLIKSLYEEGLTSYATTLEAHLDRKIKYFVYDDPYPYGSEYAVDSTAFESTQALAKWALEDHPLAPDPQHPVVSQQDVRDFMDRQMFANIAVRGWIEPAFYHLGSDYRGNGPDWYTLSYMAQEGGWAVLDYALDFAQDKLPYIKLGFASYLSSWALMNTGTSANNYGYWYPRADALNDGAVGWAFEPQKYVTTWLQSRTLNRGVWYYDGEIDLGLGGALRMAKSIVIEDDVFGVFGLGCDASFSAGKYYVVPKDGLRERLVMNNLGLSMELDRDAFAKNQNVAVGSFLASISFVLENERANAHTTLLSLNGLPEGNYTLRINGVVKYIFRPDASEKSIIELDVGSAATSDISIRLNADIDDDGDVDFGDFAKLALHWQESGCGLCSGADLTGDGKVNEDDLKEFVSQWLL